MKIIPENQLKAESDAVGHAANASEPENRRLSLHDRVTYTRKGKAKAGTSRFFRIASVYITWHEVCLTLARARG